MIESHSAAMNCVNRILFQREKFLLYWPQYFPRICDSNQKNCRQDLGLLVCHWYATRRLQIIDKTSWKSLPWFSNSLIGSQFITSKTSRFGFENFHRNAQNRVTLSKYKLLTTVKAAGHRVSWKEYNDKPNHKWGSQFDPVKT
jgi:hypothetical protein